MKRPTLCPDLLRRSALERSVVIAKADQVSAVATELGGH